MELHDKIIIFVTASSSEEAAKIGRELVENRLAACCNIIPGLQSIYRWEGKVTEDTETLLMIKSKKSAEQKVFDMIKSLHSYQLPEMISLPMIGGYEKYFEWVDESVTG